MSRMSAEDLVKYLESVGIDPDKLDDLSTHYSDYLGSYLLDQVVPTAEQVEILERIKEENAKHYSARNHEALGRYRRQLSNTFPCGSATLVYREGGNEGEGEYVARVWHFTKHDVYLRATASYYSYVGIEHWSDFEEVFPKTVQRTIYETRSAT